MLPTRNRRRLRKTQPEKRDREAPLADVEGIARTLSEVFEQAGADGLPMRQAAGRIAEHRFAA